MRDIKFCSSSYLMFRYVYDLNKSFSDTKKCNIIDISFKRFPVKRPEDLLENIERIVKSETIDNKSALALSGGIDSAILAYFMPKNSTAITFKCVVPGVEVIDETKKANHYAKLNKLNHKILEIKWEDIERVVDKLMIHKGAPIHSIETQIYLAGLYAKKLGFTKMIFGENADIIYGGMDRLISKDWYYGEFVDRYSYVMPYKVLKDSELILEPYKKYCINGHIDGHDFINEYFRQEALGTYNNACQTANINFIGPYSLTYLDEKIDYNRIRNGESKYIIRDAFKLLYPKEELPEKIPMPRPVNEWFKDWDGPKRKEFLPHCTDNMTGDQKWMVWCLERFYNLLDKEVINE